MANFNVKEFIRKSKRYFINSIAVCSLILGVLIMCINVYGLSQPIRKPELGLNDHDQLRFIPKDVLSFRESMEAIENLSVIKQNDILVEEANRIVNQSLVHIDWDRVDPSVYRQLVPVWENYMLYIVGRYSGLPQFARYHYADYKYNIRRGIGNCGDASTVLSSILDRYNISNKIVAFRGHVIVEYTDADGVGHLMDPDFGVSLRVDLERLIEKPQMVRERYIEAGYSKDETDYLLKAYQTKYNVFDDTYQFMRKRYLFEHISYIIKWLLPVLLIIASLLYFRDLIKTKKHRSF